MYNHNIKIYRNSIISNEASFSTEEELQTWLNLHEEMGTFLLTEKVETYIGFDGEEVVTVKPATHTFEITDISAKLEQERINAEALAFLISSDFKITRHKEQIDSFVATSLTEVEYQQLLVDRQAARDRIVR